ncbi:hypothetical protein AVEN_104587-1 [Araneus ventricosus]|uniref:Uncharacterized protein n=1 Tax=Araneus ventricosus TaxID=182803 RepID=A0A4Y2BCY5_ARAVE|nr:hypothetical protein AVEN_104587-1 [Araneus ventricosus]
MDFSPDLQIYISCWNKSINVACLLVCLRNVSDQPDSEKPNFGIAPLDLYQLLDQIYQRCMSVGLSSDQPDSEKPNFGIVPLGLRVNTTTQKIHRVR